MKLNIGNVSPAVVSILETNGLDPERIIRPAADFDPAEFKGRREVGSAFHGLTQTDNVVVNGTKDGKRGEQTWHGLGINVQGVMEPKDMLTLGGMDWDVDQLPLYGCKPLLEGQEFNDTIAVPTHVVNVRSDNQEVLGVVGKGYKPFHNRQLIELVQALGKGVEIETVGTIQGGKRVWALVRGSTFEVTPNDPTATYLAACAGHDGSMAINLFWTSVRLTCLNTFRRAFTGRRNGFTIRHEGGVMEKVDAAKVALGLMAETTKTEAAEALALNARTMKTEEVQRFFLEVYTATEGAIPANPKTEAETKSREKALATIKQWGENFDADRQAVKGAASVWTAYNAITEWYDHNRMVKGRNDQHRAQNRIYGNFFGLSSERKQTARRHALATLI